MSIIKSKHASNYTVLPNVVFNTNLSLGAIGLLAKLLSLPHDWVIHKTQLHIQFDIGRDRLSSYFEELESSGFILSVRKNTAKGAVYEYVVYDIPYNGESSPLTENPLTGNPLTGNPFTENPSLLSKDIQSKQILNKQIQISFDRFWELYDKKVGKAETQRKFMKLPQKEIDKIFETLPAYIESTPDPTYRKNPKTYLNGKHWEDEIKLAPKEPQQPTLPMFNPKKP
jgi:hypothetical protein